MTDKYTNRLIHEKSPYLLQHAHNPVDWYPWGEEAFMKARNKKMPIFLSVGYSTCHWCHVMEHESFEDESIADMMNKNFINIKVNREENPAVDKLYMTFIQLSSGRGGWPMSVFLTPELKPFFGGSYFPPDDRYGKPGFKSIIQNLSELWYQDPSKVIQSGEDIINRVKFYLRSQPPEQGSEVNPSKIAHTTYSYFKSSYDSINGGFSKAPKFPTPVQIQFLLNYYVYHRKTNPAESENALNMALFTLEKITMGGIHDHVGGGFHRYSTDKKWHVPHFEKMLYDQAQLLSLYSSAYIITRKEIFASTIRDIIQYVSRDLFKAKGGFYSAEDADSLPTKDSPKKKEGAFCVWELNEIESLLEPQHVSIISSYYDIREEGNVDPSHDSQGELANKNVLAVSTDLESLSKKFGLPTSEIQLIIYGCNATLWIHRRNHRPKPDLDDKILTAWNGLMISGLTRAFEAIRDLNALCLAISTAEFLYNELYDQSTHVLYRIYCDGLSNIEGFVDDYSNLIQGLIDLYQVTLDEKWIKWANDLQKKQDDLFYDNNRGGYFNVSLHDKNILIRMKDELDGAEPSANAVSMSNLTRLYSLLNVSENKTRADAAVRAFQTQLTAIPYVMPSMVCSCLLLQYGLKEIIIVGAGDTLNEWLNIIHSVFLPNKLIMLARQNGFLCMNPTVKEIADKNTSPTVYICTHFQCSPPIHDSELLNKMLIE
ncbi:spermatogenesis-associated protein 20 [Pilobolus umbonatus]|nr:spermatogenesis-associated protein 20 [Pilobolus umbonatus]